MEPFDWGLLGVGVTLQCLVLSTILKGSLRQYPLVFVYIVVNLLSTVVQISFRHYFGPRSREFVQAYWVSDFVGTLVMLLIIIHLVRLAMEAHKYQDTVYWGLLSGVLVTGVASGLLIYSRGFSLGRLMTQVGRDYYFAAVILNALLWVTLVRRHHENKQLYLLASGLGLQLSGAAIAHALRMTSSTSPVVVGFANGFLVTTYLANLLVWYLALKRFPALAPAEPQPEAPAESAWR